MNIKLTYKEIHKLIDLGIDIKVDTPFGLKSIREKFIKEDVGYVLSYNDNTETKCAVSHNILMENDLKSASDIIIGDKTSTGKIVVSKRAVPLQSWYDFEINHRSGFYYQNGVVHHNSGKSLTIALMAEFFRQNNMKGILLVPNINLLTQFKNDIKDYNLIDLYEDTHVIGGGQTERHFNNSLTISTWQSLQDLSMVNLDELDYVICDETHRFASDVTASIVKHTVNCKYKFGFTGTLPEDPCMKMELLGLFGLPKTYITSRELIDRGLATPIEINSIIFNYKNDEKSIFNNIGSQYNKKLQFLKEHKKRNEFIVNMTCKIKKSGNTLVLFQHTEHGKTLFIDTMKNLYPDVIVENKNIVGKKSFEFQEQYGVYFLNGEDDAKTREKTRKILEEHSDAVLIANYSLLSTGVNIKRLHNMILASPLKAFTTVTQSIGRLMRLHPEKLKARVFDLIDNFGYKKVGGIFYKQYQHRLKTSYYPEEYPIKEVYYDLF